jgi:hypothetical protein
MAMRRSLILAIAAALMATAAWCGSRAARAAKPDKPKEPVGIKYEVSTSQEGGDEVVLTKIWIKGDKQRVEEDGQVKVKVGDTVTIWSEKGKEASRWKGVSDFFDLSPWALPMVSRTFKERAKKIGEQTIAGRACDIYYWTTRMPPPPPGGKSVAEPENKLWLSKDYGIPMKIVRSNLGPNVPVFVSTAQKIEVGVNIPDSMFEPPEGVKVVDKEVARPKPQR